MSQNEAFNLTDLGVSESSFFPHVSSRNYHISFNFGGNPEPHYPPPDETYCPLQEAGEEERECVPVTTTPKGECEVIMMVGLPGCGKTFWINRHLSRNPDKDVRVIGPYQILERMLVSSSILLLLLYLFIYLIYLFILFCSQRREGQ